jgi:nucleotide-binding universal stress UspA family protein
VSAPQAGRGAASSQRWKPVAAPHSDASEATRAAPPSRASGVAHRRRRARGAAVASPSQEMDVAVRILVGTDFSPTAERALSLAGEVARGLGAEIVLLHVDEIPETAPLAEVAAARREHARVALESLRQTLALSGGDVSVQVLLRPGDPAREILRVAAANGARVIVIGTHGESAAGLLLGSVSDRVVRYAAVPVLVVPDSMRRPSAAPPPPASRRIAQQAPA